ncbi:MAG: MarR family transcriptional regulator [Exiguobacterium oxidotolerans]|uniref:Putative transcriptional regulator (MarR family) n=1 Tax=Exiguobacterium oxidotolerans TaxID=223958 RepID=A0A653I8Q0_9BACL|nr:MarR family transcriptional regulator [Exiguobacterium oxidotolerans]VWX35278.1 putative transcriptional regulator (MarR family) [Exiguobacterium oxidotolerans]
MSISCTEKGRLIYALVSVNKTIAQKFDLCTDGFSQTRMDLLAQLEVGKTISQKELQQRVNVDNAAVTRHLKHLETNGMIQRVRSESDNRVILVSLTAEGATRITQLRQQKDDFLESLLTGFTEEEQDQLAQMIQRIEDNALTLPKTTAP